MFFETARNSPSFAVARIQILPRRRDFLGPLFVFSVLLVGCGAPGDPIPPSPPVPTPVADLSARQAGDGIQLTFSMPTKTVRGERLTEAPAIEVLRGTAKSDGSPNLKSLQVVETIPGELAAKYQADDHVQIVAPITPSEQPRKLRQHIRLRDSTRASRKRTSPDSNPVIVHVYPAPAGVGQMTAKLTEHSIDLTWSAVTQTSSGEPITVSEYRIYRGELDPRSYNPAAGMTDILHEKFIIPRRSAESLRCRRVSRHAVRIRQDLPLRSESCRNGSGQPVGVQRLRSARA